LTDGVSSTASNREWPVLAVAPAVLLLIFAVTIGPRLGGLIRPLFVVGCGAAGWYAWRAGPYAHVQAALVLFAFSPFARRIVDLPLGYDQSGIMLVGPMLAILAPLPSLRHYLDEKEDLMRPGLGPIVVVAASVVYAAALAMFQGEWFNAASGALKWGAPLVYAAVLLREADRERMIQAITSAFVLILPITGIIGIFQYLNPPEWDRYWMQFALTTAGRPFPYEVRVFSTMNGPASFAAFTAAGLLLVCFLRSRWFLLVSALPAAFALLLSSYRTSWISFTIGMLFCMLFSATRKRASTMVLGILGIVAVTVTLPPFADVISDRLASVSQGTKDDSAQERLDEYAQLWSQPDSSLFGTGFTVGDVGAAGTMPVDGMIIACWLTMGIVVGLLCLAALIWAAWSMIAVAWRDGQPETIIIGALGCGALAQLPLASLTSGELGFLFWTFAALAAARSSLVSSESL
jgi:O-Antigen ligase